MGLASLDSIDQRRQVAASQKMNPEIKSRIHRDFPPGQQIDVISALNRLGLKDVMAESQYNLDNTLSAILQLSKGNIADVYSLVEAAKNDFRDVIYWATLEPGNQD